MPAKPDEDAEQGQTTILNRSEWFNWMYEQLLFETKVVVFFINLFVPGKKKLMVENGRDQPLNGVSIYILRRWDYEYNGVLFRKKVNIIILCMSVLRSNSHHSIFSSSKRALGEETFQREIMMGKS